MQTLNLKNNYNRFGYIDALRGIAAILVVLQHSLEFSLNAPHAAAPLNSIIRSACLDYCNLGRIGVVIFFLISGYVIPFSFKGGTPLRGFIIARFFRLYPAYWASIVLGLIVLSLVDGIDFSSIQIIANITMLQMFFLQPNILGVYWTLGLELVFYVLCFFIFMRGRLLSPHYQAQSTIGLMLLALAAALVKWKTQHNGIPVGAITLIALMYIGTLARMALIEKDVTAIKLLPRILVCVSLISPVIFYIGYSRTSESWIANSTGLYIGMVMFLFCIKRKVSAHSIAVYLGWISYSVYLSHPILLPIARHLFASTFWPLPVILIPLSVVVGSILMASAMYYLIEKPAINLGRKWVAALT